jgi:ABC-type transporter Mla maintaining outer membrane lipid asymmetry ATPase subunit MlaF
MFNKQINLIGTYNKTLNKTYKSIVHDTSNATLNITFNNTYRIQLVTKKKIRKKKDIVQNENKFEKKFQRYCKGETQKRYGRHTNTYTSKVNKTIRKTSNKKRLELLWEVQYLQ